MAINIGEEIYGTIEPKQNSDINICHFSYVIILRNEISDINHSVAGSGIVQLLMSLSPSVMNT